MPGQIHRRALAKQMRAVLVIAALLPILILAAAWVRVSTTKGQSIPPVLLPGDRANTATIPTPLATSVVHGSTASTSAAIANFNLYGCTESAPLWPSCADRFPRQWEYVNRYHLSIVGLQELEPGPYALFRDKVDAPGSGWALYPRRPEFVRQQTTGVLWRTDQWRLLDAEEFEIPKYSWHDSSGTRTLYAHDAAVLLQSLSGARLWVLSVHNMSSENANFASGLAQDETIEAEQFGNRSRNGVPVVLLGDFNDDTDQPICAVRHGTPQAHSIWGAVPVGDCSNPAGSNGQPYDKVIASGNVTFTDSGIDWSTQADKLTDHGIAWVDVVLK